MSSCWGRNLRVSIFGESHGSAIGCVVDGLPAGEKIDLEALRHFLSRRAPGQGAHATARKESDAPEILSGLLDGHTTGAPLAAVIVNCDQHSGDYDSLRDIPRPGHADYPAQIRYRGCQDARGGGHFSGRLTAPMCVAGGIAMQILERRGVIVGAHLLNVGEVDDTPFDAVSPTAAELLAPGRAFFPVNDAAAGERMLREIADAAAHGDSVGGCIEVAAIGVPAGIGSPIFDGVENRLAALFFGIPAVKCVEFGSGKAVGRMRGSQDNDPYVVVDGCIRTATNHHGGALGGITTGMPIIARLSIKPTPSIAQPQSSVSLSRLEPVELRIKGRHDPCIAPRAVPVAEAAMALGLLDLMGPF